MKIALITDTHFGVRNDSQIFQRYFDKFLDDIFFPVLEERKIKTLLHLGDLVDRRKYINFVTLGHIRKKFVFGLADLNIDTHIVVGNHDTYYKNTNEVNALTELFSTYEGTAEPWMYLNPTTKEFDGLKICLMPWICPQNYDACMNEMRNTDAQVLMGHLEVNGYTMFPGALCDHGLDRSIFSKFDYVYSGHFHYKSGDSTIKYLGSPWELMWSDYGDTKGFYIFDTMSRDLEFIENPYHIFTKIEYNDADGDMENYEFDNVENSYVKVIVYDKKNPYLFDKFIDKLYRHNPTDVNIIEDAYSILEESGNFDFEAEDTLTTLLKYVGEMDLDVKKIKLEELMRGLYIEAHDHI